MAQQTAPDVIDPKILLNVLGAIERGDFSHRMPDDWTGAAGKVADSINRIIDTADRTIDEFTRTCQAVGREGRFSDRIRPVGARGKWENFIDGGNALIADFVSPMGELIAVMNRLAEGEVRVRMPLERDGTPLKGEFRGLAEIVNTMVGQLGRVASEVTRVAREVGTEGKLGGQARVEGVAGTWKDLTDNVNLLTGNLTAQVRNIAEVTTAVAKGDLSKKITVDAKGEILELKNTINTMVDQLNSFASEVTRVAREVGTEGKLGGQAQVRGVGGTWKDLTDNVNLLTGNLTAQVRNIAEVTTAVAKGDLSKKITVEVKGEVLELKDTINIMVDQLNAFASEVTRVAREVGTEGKLGGQAQVPGVGGTWKDLTDNVNSMAANLTDQVRNIADVTTAVANGDMSRKITVDVQGELLQLKETVNTMVDQLRSFASEVTRVVREVGTDGKLGGQAQVPGVGGTWKDLTDNVNTMVGNLTDQVRNIAEVTFAVAGGDLSRKITVDVRGEFLQLKETINTMVDQLRAFASEVTRVAREVGMEGRLGGQAFVTGVAGTWKDLTDSVNMMAANLTSQVRNIAGVTTAVANGDLSKKITVDVRGEILELKNTVNTMVDQLNAFSAEVTRVAREVGTEGRLGGQAQVRGVSGVWKDLTDSVNFMAANLTDQVRGIAKVVTAVANGDLKRRLTVEAKGEIADLAETINAMTETLALFADQVTSVAREVGVQGKLGGQANVPGAAGTWKDLTDNVNQLAANLTNQVRAIADVATSVTKGDLTRSITVMARGEVADLKDNLNEMIRNLRETTRQNTEQDWLKTNLARFTRLLQGQRDLLAVSKLVLSELAPLVSAQHGVFFIADERGAEPALSLLTTYGYRERKNIAKRFAIGEGLVGECAYERQRILLTNVPTDYIQISSGLGEASPLNIVVLPILFEGVVKAVVELASFQRFSATHLMFLDQLAESMGIVLNTIEANMRTEELLKQSQSLASELQGQQEELRQTNEELEEKAALLAEQKREVERKNREVGLAKRTIEEKASQLAVTSKYKSQFLSNMSHELRTPLNSLLILSQELISNPEGNLTPRQIEFARTISGSSNDLLSLINEILDLSKIESGTVEMAWSRVSIHSVAMQMDRLFRPLTERKRLSFQVDLADDLPPSIITDEKRLNQILRNLLSNACKFTEDGEITFRAAPAAHGWSLDIATLNGAEMVVAFAVSDTGIGIPPAKQQIVFEAFQQVDASASRRYGGTGLGLSISRELATLLGGELKLTRSVLGEGSEFVLFLPIAPGWEAGQEHGGAAAEPGTAGRALRPALATPLPTEDDRDVIESGDKILLIIEDDPVFAGILRDFGRGKGFRCLVTGFGTEGLSLAEDYQPDAITLDIHLPDIDGWAVLNELKANPATRHVPVDVVSVVSASEGRSRSVQAGAYRYLAKPVSKEAVSEAIQGLARLGSRRARSVLVIGGEEKDRHEAAAAIESPGITVKAIADGSEGLDLLRKRRFDCVVVVGNLSDMPTERFIVAVRNGASSKWTPILVNANVEVAGEVLAAIQKDEGNGAVKIVTSRDELIAQASIFLHRVLETISPDALPPSSPTAASPEDEPRQMRLAGRKVLLVDDDMRNVFALTAALERHRMQVTSVQSGEAAIHALADEDAADVVLMDVMMPEMDGFETMRVLRQETRLHDLPIIALTAKAMMGDREQCLQAGASGYLSKPVKIGDLLALMSQLLADRAEPTPPDPPAPNDES